MSNKGSYQAQLQAMVALMLNDAPHITLARYTDADGPIFKTDVNRAKMYAERFNNHGWGVSVAMGKLDANNRYIKVYYNKPQRLMTEADIERLSK